MTDLEMTLNWLGLSQYLDRFMDAGFDSWESVLEMTEQDLENLNVALGHRRRLQREISRAKDATNTSMQQGTAFVMPMFGQQQINVFSEQSGQIRDNADLHVSYQQPVPVFNMPATQQHGRHTQHVQLRGFDQQDPSGGSRSLHPPSSQLLPQTSQSQQQEDGDQPVTMTPNKRSYRHHPKPDPHAPSRPYSAYVMFANEVRQELLADKESSSLDFPEISKIVGQRWQQLPAAEKEAWQKHAAGPWETYKQELSAYQQTDPAKEYKQYLEHFKAGQAVKDRIAARESTRSSARTSESQQRKPSIKIETQDRREDTGMLMLSYQTPTQTSFEGSANTETDSRSAAPLATQIIRSSMQSEIPKVPIQGLRRGSSGMQTESGEDGARQRTKQACEPCRQRKTKCNAVKPRCGHCDEIKIDCFYSGGKRDMDKQRLQQMSEKLDEYDRLLHRLQPRVQLEDQLAIQQVLNSPLPVSDSQTSKVRKPRPETRTSNADDENPDDISGVGSMGCTSHVNDESFLGETEEHPRAFAGQSSNSQWIQRLKGELDVEPGDQTHTVSSTRSGLPVPIPVSQQAFAEDTDTSLVGIQVDPFSLPEKRNADTLVRAYFDTVHYCMPILNGPNFLQQYGKLASFWDDPEALEDPMFLTTLHLVLAIGVVHTRFCGPAPLTDDRDHLLYYARARTLGVDAGILNNVALLYKVQIFGLGAMYSLVTDQLERAWDISGLAMRGAQALGLHLYDSTPSTPSAEKDFRSRVWFALLAFERTLAVMTGRPSMIQDRDCSVSLGSECEPTPSGSQSAASYTASSPMQTDTRDSSLSQSDAPSSSFQKGDNKKVDKPAIAVSYFKYYVELCSLAQEVVAHLYAPRIREHKWSKILAMIESFDERLTTWSTRLESPFASHLSHPPPDLQSSPFTVHLAIQFHCVRTIINRPCLCRLERQISSQSSHVAVSRCITSARQVVDLTVESPKKMLMEQGPVWWLLVHHVKRALAVLLLELAFRSEHMPSEAEDILSEAKSALSWLQQMGTTSSSARHAYVTMKELVRQAGRRVGVDTGDLSKLGAGSVVPGWVPNIHPRIHGGIGSMTDQQRMMHANIGFNAPFDPMIGPPTNVQSHGQIRNDFLGPNAFDHFSFEPSYFGGPGATIPGQYSPLDQVPVSSPPQEQQYQQQYQRQSQQQYHEQQQQQNRFQDNAWFGFDGA